MKLSHQIIISFVILLVATGVEAKKEHLIQGRTMGTTYHITVVTGYFKGIGDLKEKIDARLNEINHVFSTYISDSEISRFNAFNETGEKFQVSDDFIEVMNVGRNIHQLSEGAWDGTVNPSG